MEPSELRYAVSILDGLVKEGYEHQVDCMYGAATALYLLGDYQEARVRLQIKCVPKYHDSMVPIITHPSCFLFFSPFLLTVTMREHYAIQARRSVRQGAAFGDD
jgi:hypothetical protein